MRKKASHLKVIPSASAPKREAPVEYHFNDADYEQFHGRFWRLSRERVELGMLARVWRGPDGVETPSASCILPALALNSWPQAGEEWSPPTYLSHRTIAALAGVDKNSVGRGMHRLEEIGLLRLLDRERIARHGGAARRAFQLHRDCFPATGDRFFKLDGGLVYGGALAMLPRASARHMFLAVAALDPLFDEEELRAHMQADEGRDVAASLRRRRHESTSTMATLVEVSGLASSTAHEALAILLAPTFGKDRDIPLVRRDHGRFGTHYFVASEAINYRWIPEVLNDPARRAEVRRDRWGAHSRRAA